MLSQEVLDFADKLGEKLQNRFNKAKEKEDYLIMISKRLTGLRKAGFILKPLEKVRYDKEGEVI